MLSRRVAPRVAVAGVQARALNTQMADERWYGHHFYFDNHVYKYTGETPKWMRPDGMTAEDKARRMEQLPAMDFGSTYEAITWDAARQNEHLGRKEFANEVRFRLEKQSSTVYRAQQLMKDNLDEKTEDRQIAKIFDEEHVAAELKYIKTIRANEFAEDSRLDILPGGSPSSLREKTRWNLALELHPQDRADIMKRLMAWLPEKYHIVYQDDVQGACANNAYVRDSVLEIVANVEKEHAEEAKKLGFEADLKEECEALRDEADPTRDITMAKIQASSNLEELEKWSRAVHEYNGDARLLAIYEKAASITGNEGHKKLVANLKAWKGATPDWASSNADKKAAAAKMNQ